MLTNITDDTFKKYIISQFCSPQSRLRVVIATVAFGMDINCPDVSCSYVVKLTQQTKNCLEYVVVDSTLFTATSRG